MCTTGHVNTLYEAAVHVELNALALRAFLQRNGPPRTVGVPTGRHPVDRRLSVTVDQESERGNGRAQVKVIRWASLNAFCESFDNDIVKFLSSLF